jgi:lipopolysaccharide transport system ATP-binding protein
MNNAVEVKKLGKKYTIREREKYLTLRDVFVKAAKVPANLIQGKKFRKKEDFWALKDVSFDVKEGEVIGIIGRNGAGKSTLLKVLSRITEPTEGEVRLKGRVSSLLEVGTGFHPELTGRENIYLNGAIMGMRKKEIEKKFDEIVEFSGVGQFLDMPVKRYSSGMQVRLAFSVAAHLESDILLVDEVLAVGDAEFQKKCLRKMDEVTEKAGRTILFVSHNMGAIRRICSKIIILEQGAVVFEGDVNDGIKKYFLDQTINKADIEFKKGKNIDSKKLYFNKAMLFDSKGSPKVHFKYGEKIVLEIDYIVTKKIRNSILGVEITNGEGVSILTTTSQDAKGTINNKKVPGEYKYQLEIDTSLFTKPNSYYIYFSSAIPKVEFLDAPRESLYFDVSDGGKSPSYLLEHSRRGVIEPIFEWKENKI